MERIGLSVSTCIFANETVPKATITRTLDTLGFDSERVEELATRILKDLTPTKIGRALKLSRVDEETVTLEVVCNGQPKTPSRMIKYRVLGDVPPESCGLDDRRVE